MLELEELRCLVNEGIESGFSVDAKIVFSRLRANYSTTPNEQAMRALEAPRIDFSFFACFSTLALKLLLLGTPNPLKSNPSSCFEVQL